MENFSGVNFNYTYRLDFVLAIGIQFDKNFICAKVQAERVRMK